MKINPHSRDSFKASKNLKVCHFKGEQKTLKIRAGTIAKFKQKTAFKSLDKAKKRETINKKKKIDFEKIKGKEFSSSISQNTNKKNQSFLSPNHKKSNILSNQEKLVDSKKHKKSTVLKKQEKSDDQKKQEQSIESKNEKNNSLSRSNRKNRKKQRIKNDRFNTSYAKNIKSVGTKQLVNKTVAIVEQDEDAEGIGQIKNQAKNSNRLVKGTKKAQRFVSKNEKFSQSVTTGKLDDIRFSSIKNVKSTKTVTDYSIKKNIPKSANFSRISTQVRQTVTKIVNKTVSSLTSGNPIIWIGVGIFVVLIMFIGMIVTLSSQNDTSSGNEGEMYVKHWDGKDAYHSSLLAQRYGIKAEQIDSFIKSEGFTVDQRATGKEFLRLQALSGIDVRILVAFGQMESSFGTAGVAKEFPKANIFGYGSFDNDPNQGASWDNTRAVKEFRSTQIDDFGNRTMAIMDERASAYHSNSLKPGEFVYWTQLNAGKPRAEIAEKLDKWIDAHGGTPKPPGGYGPINGGGSGGAGLANLDKMLGKVISGEYGGETGQCYAVSAYYAHSINPKIILRNGVRASAIGSDYPWASWNWKVINNPQYKDIRAGDIINYAPGANMGTWNTDSYYGHTGVVGKVLGNNQYILYDQNPTPLKTWKVTFTKGSVASVVRPPNQKKK